MLLTNKCAVIKGWDSRIAFVYCTKCSIVAFSVRDKTYQATDLPDLKLNIQSPESYQIVSQKKVPSASERGEAPFFLVIKTMRSVLTRQRRRNMP